MRPSGPTPLNTRYFIDDRLWPYSQKGVDDLDPEKFNLLPDTNLGIDRLREPVLNQEARTTSTLLPPPTQQV